MLMLIPKFAVSPTASGDGLAERGRIAHCTEQARFGGEIWVQSQTVWRNKHLVSHQDLLWSRASYPQQESSDISFYLSGLKGGFIFNPID